jgi:hypothetical protein
MNKRLGGYVVLIAVISLVLFAGCGRHHDDGIDPNLASKITVTSDKTTALANGIEDITLTAEVKNADGALLSGKAISFVITAGTGSLHSADAATNASGLASVMLRRDPISAPTTSEYVTVAALADSATGTITVKFVDMIVTLTADKEIALANGNDPVSPERITLTAEVKRADGTFLPGQGVTFAITAGSGVLANAGAATNASGLVSVTLQRNPIASPATREDVTVTATTGGVSGTKTVRFINLPGSAALEIALNRVVTDLAILTFDLVSSPTLSAPTFLAVTPIGAAITPPFIGPSGPGTQNTFTALLGSTTYSLFTSVVPGITTSVNGAIVGFTYGIDSTIKSLPTFTVTTQPTYFPALTSGGVPVLPAVTQADFVVTTIFDTDK